MSLFAQAAHTYDTIMQIGKKECNAETLAPVFYKAAEINVIVHLNADGILLDISEQKDKKNPVMGIMPVTEASAGRSSGSAPHPLIEDIKYLTTSENVDDYLKQLKAWCEAEPENTAINAVYRYVSGGTLTSDLEHCNIAVKDKDGKPSKKLIGWLIATPDGPVKTWDNVELIKSYTKYASKSFDTAEKVFCMISGKKEVPIENVPKLPKIAKLISSNDSTNYSYRGRFVESRDALTTGYITTQKAINVLTWLLTNKHFCLPLGDNAQLLCWRPDGLEIQRPDTLFDFDEPTREFPAYRKMMEARIRNRIQEIPIEKRNVVVTILNATSIGRGSVKYYSERNLEEFLTNLADWDLECCWINKDGIKSPELRELALSAFGLFDSEKGFIRGNSNPAYENAFTSLITRRIDNGRIPAEIVNALVSRCEKIAVYIGSEADKKWDMTNRLLFVACATIRKHYIDNGVKEYNMTLDKDSKDRSYQWGRLLAVYEKIEKDALYDAGNKNNDKIVTNATRMLSTFIRRPSYTAALLDTKLRTAYYPRFTGGKTGWLVNHEKTIQEIMQHLAEIPENEFNKPLKPSYLLGYYLQKASYYQNPSDNEN